MKLFRLAMLASLLCLALVAPSAAPADPVLRAGAAAPTANAAACPDTIRLGNRRYAYYQHRVNCTRARRAVKRLFASRGGEGTPSGFRCRSRTDFRRNGGCSTPSRGRYFGFYR